MPSMKDLAGSQAAAKLMQSLGGPAGALPEEALPMPEGPEAGADPEMLLEQLAAMLEGLPEDAANEARTHLNALRELLTQGEAQAQGQVPPEMPAPQGGEGMEV